MTVKCPACKKNVDSGEPHFPFCSERCSILDLGDWADEKFVISTPIEHSTEPTDDEDAE